MVLFNRILQSFALASGMVAFVSLLWVIYGDYALWADNARAERNRELRRWAAVTVFDILDQREALSIDNLLKEFQAKGLPEAAIGRGDLSREALIRVLLEMKSGGLIVYDGVQVAIRGTPGDRSVSSLVGMADMLNAQMALEEETRIIAASSDIYMSLKQSEIPIRLVDFVARVSQITGINNATVTALLQREIGAGYIEQENGRIFIPALDLGRRQVAE